MLILLGIIQIEIIDDNGNERTEGQIFVQGHLAAEPGPECGFFSPRAVGLDLDFEERLMKELVVSQQHTYNL